MKGLVKNYQRGAVLLTWSKKRVRGENLPGLCKVQSNGISSIRAVPIRAVNVNIIYTYTYYI